MKFTTIIAIATVSMLASAPAFASGDDAMSVDQRYETQAPRPANARQVEMRKGDAPVAREFLKSIAPDAAAINRADQAGNR